MFRIVVDSQSLFVIERAHTDAMGNKSWHGVIIQQDDFIHIPIIRAAFVEQRDTIEALNRRLAGEEGEVCP